MENLKEGVSRGEMDRKNLALMYLLLVLLVHDSLSVGGGLPMALILM